jgi:4-amino-4-deoxy-L-arabinose transferase-like glycosyltransferase
MKVLQETSSMNSRFSSSTLVLLVAVLVLTWFLRVNFWDQPLQMDEGVYGYVAWSMSQGAVPYKDIYDHKPPGIYLLYRLAFLLFHPTALSIKVFATIYTLGTVVALFFLAKNLAGNTVGYLAALLFGIFSSGPKIEGGGANTEVFMILPYTLAAYSLFKAVKTGRRRDYLLTGLWTGLACTIKQVAAVNLLWVGTYLIVRMWRQKKWANVAQVTYDGCLVVIGAILPWLPYSIYFYLNDALSDFYFWQVSFNLDYVAKGHGSLGNLSILYHQTKDILKENGTLWLLAMSAIYYEWRRLAVSHPGTRTPDEQRDVFFLLATWPLFSFLGVSLGGRFFGHYFIQTIPSLAVLGGIGLIKLYRVVRTRGLELLRYPVSLVLSLLFAKAFLLFMITDAPYYLSYNADQISFHQYHTPLFSVTRFIGKYLQQRTQPDELVYVWATNPEINFYALRRAPSPFLVHRSENRLPTEEVMQSLQGSPPKYIVAIDDMTRFPQLQDYIQRNYHQETSTELEKLKKLVMFEIYRLKES